MFKAVLSLAIAVATAIPVMAQPEAGMRVAQVVLMDSTPSTSKVVGFLTLDATTNSSDQKMVGFMMNIGGKLARFQLYSGNIYECCRIYYKTSDCSGTVYTNVPATTPGVPWAQAVVQGKRLTVYLPGEGTPENFTPSSWRTETGVCEEEPDAAGDYWPTSPVLDLVDVFTLPFRVVARTF
jgi:hypothetical protein